MDSLLVILFAPALIGVAVALTASFLGDTMHGWFRGPIQRIEPWRPDPDGGGEPAVVLEWKQAA